MVESEALRFPSESEKAWYLGSPTQTFRAYELLHIVQPTSLFIVSGESFWRSALISGVIRHALLSRAKNCHSVPQYRQYIYTWLRHPPGSLWDPPPRFRETADDAKSGAVSGSFRKQQLPCCMLMKSSALSKGNLLAHPVIGWEGET